MSERVVIFCPRFECSGIELETGEDLTEAWAEGYEISATCPKCGLDDVRIRVKSETLKKEDEER